MTGHQKSRLLVFMVWKRTNATGEKMMNQDEEWKTQEESQSFTVLSETVAERCFGTLKRRFYDLQQQYKQNYESNQREYS